MKAWGTSRTTNNGAFKPFVPILAMFVRKLKNHVLKHLIKHSTNLSICG